MLFSSSERKATTLSPCNYSRITKLYPYARRAQNSNINTLWVQKHCEMKPSLLHQVLLEWKGENGMHLPPIWASKLLSGKPQKSSRLTSQASPSPPEPPPHTHTHSLGTHQTVPPKIVVQKLCLDMRIKNYVH